MMMQQRLTSRAGQQACRRSLCSATHLRTLSVKQPLRTVIVRAAEPPPSGDKKALKREEEPEEFFMSKAEQSGNVMKDPMAIVGILGIFFPFVLLGVAVAAGVVDLSVYRGN